MVAAALVVVFACYRRQWDTHNQSTLTGVRCKLKHARSWIYIYIYKFFVFLIDDHDDDDENDKFSPVT